MVQSVTMKRITLWLRCLSKSIINYHYGERISIWRKVYEIQEKIIQQYMLSYPRVSDLRYDCISQPETQIDISQ